MSSSSSPIFSNPSATPKSPYTPPNFPAKLLPISFPPSPTSKLPKQTTKLHVSSPANKTSGYLVANLLLGFTLFWLPLSLAAVSRAFFLRYRFTNLRVTVISGLTGEDRSDFSYKVIKDVKVVPRFIGEWGDIVITLKDGTVVDLRSVPKFREIAKYCLNMAGKSGESEVKEIKDAEPKGF
ncbi:hypothetical protein ACHQM5_011402 [Ranunculus cassubicifolius]